MPIIRNPFRKSGVEPQGENRPPLQGGADRGFQQTKVVGAKPVDIKEPTEYKLSEINDSGVYLPPSPTEKKSFWSSRSNTSTNSSNHRSVLSENEPFSISRESFDSYRRSFDISARSPIPDMDSFPDKASTLDEPACPMSECPAIVYPAPLSEGFEEVGLNDEVKPKRRGLFSRFGDSSEANSSPDTKPVSGHHSFHFTGRKRAQSGAGAELKSMPKPAGSHAVEVPVEAK
ncbi:hypothetical protein H2199_001502 [Coniosporium tulheliwenetii]|uniref:Uncharacterized protein n=1 Tax=Coniosporium tulheliwenetii TaxID=3383036 RepID=A0ACC2ZJQ4_9PEZI|nr:hypothetical protein H2199_001502 [Cladosporium sp. JES 115]